MTNEKRIRELDELEFGEPEIGSIIAGPNVIYGILDDRLTLMHSFAPIKITVTKEIEYDNLNWITVLDDKTVLIGYKKLGIELIPHRDKMINDLYDHLKTLDTE